MNEKEDGPSTLTYTETRLNLLTVLIEKLEKNIEQRFKSDAERQQVYVRGFDERFVHLTQMFETGQETAKRAVDKAEAAQSAHNIASNEWRGTLNDFKSTLISRPEFERFYAEFSAYRLESARISSITQGEKASAKDSSQSTLAMVAIVIAVLAIIVPFFVHK